MNFDDIPEFEEISKHFIEVIIPSDKYDSMGRTESTSLLLPNFYEKVKSGIEIFNNKYPDIEVIIYETYRSNPRQYRLYKQGASKVKENGMHHYGIACDIAFKIEGEFTYKGDYKYLHNSFGENGLVKLSWEDAHIQYIPVNTQDELRNEVKGEIKKIQKKYDLIVDGIIGPKTIKKIKEIYSS
jgi:hypothetical protein